MIYLRLPARGEPTDLVGSPWWWSSAYVTGDEETTALVAFADHQLRAAHTAGARLVGHQLCSDLAVLLAAADHTPISTTSPTPNRPDRYAAGAPAALGVRAAREAWRARRRHPGPIDTRYDAGHLLAGHQSRRLVDVCAALNLDVTQPELRGTSMTALHRSWLQTADPALRERITVLNLRHSLSTALVAALAIGAAPPPAHTVNVNRLLAGRLAGQFAYIDSSAFTALL